MLAEILLQDRITRKQLRERQGHGRRARLGEGDGVGAHGGWGREHLGLATGQSRVGFRRGSGKVGVGDSWSGSALQVAAQRSRVQFSKPAKPLPRACSLWRVFICPGVPCTTQSRRLPSMSRQIFSSSAASSPTGTCCLRAPEPPSAPGAARQVLGNHSCTSELTSAATYIVVSYG